MQQHNSYSTDNPRVGWKVMVISRIKCFFVEILKSPRAQNHLSENVTRSAFFCVCHAAVLAITYYANFLVPQQRAP